MLGDIFQRQYDFEHQRRGELTSATNSPIVAVTVLSSAAAVVLLDYPYDSSLSTIGFAVMAVATLLALFTAIYYVFRSMWNYVYKKLAPATALSAHLRELTGWHLSQGADAVRADELAKQDFGEYVSEHLSEAADWNGQVNDRRGNFLHMGTTAVAVALALFVPTALLYACAKAIAPDKVHHVELTNRSSQHQERNMPPLLENNTSTPASAPAPAQTTPAITPTSAQPKPVGPSNSQFRTNTEIPRPQADGLVKKSGD